MIDAGGQMIHHAIEAVLGAIGQPFSWLWEDGGVQWMDIP